MLGDCLAGAVEYPLKVVQLPRELHFDDYQVSLAVLGLDIHAVELVVFRLLVRLALEELDNLHVLFQKHGNQSLEDSEVGLVPEHVFHRPVKPNICIVLLHNLIKISTKIA